MADHIVWRYVSTRYTTGYENTTAGETVSSASSNISTTGADADGADRLIIAACSGAISSASFQGSTTWDASDADVTSEALHAWANTTTGVGGGLSIGNGLLDTASPSGTWTSTWASATKQANISFAIVGTQDPELYDQTTGAGVDDVTVTAPIYGGGFGLFLYVQTANEQVDTPSGWTLIGTVGEGTAAASGSTRVTVFWADADTVSDDTPTLSISAAGAPDISHSVFPSTIARRSNLALTLAAAVMPFTAAIADIEAEPLSWASTFPAQAYRAPAPVNEGGAFAPSPVPIPNESAPELSWSSTFPAQAYRAREAINEGGAFAPSPDPLPDAAAPELSWLSVYPDSAPGRRPLVHGGTFDPPSDTSSPATTDIGWLPSFPDFIPGPRFHNEGGATPVWSFGGSPFTIGVAACEQKIFGTSPEEGTLSTRGTDITVSSVDHTTDLFTATTHGLQVCDGPYRFSTTGTFPTGIDGDTDYYIDVEDADTFKVSTTAANAKANTNVSISSNGSGTLTLVRTIDTAALGSCIVAFAARGYWNLDGSAPTDSKGNTFTAAASSPNYYDSYPNSATWVGYKFDAAGGAAHTFSASYVNFDEPTVGGLEIFGVNQLQDASHVERSGAATITSDSVTVTARALLVALVFGSGPVSQDHTWTFLDGFAKIPSASDEGDVSINGYIQVAVAYRVVNPGTYTFSAQGTSNEGAQLYLLAFQAQASEEIAFDWHSQPVDPVWPVRTVPGYTAAPVEPPESVTELSWSPTFPDAAPGPRRHPFGGTSEPAFAGLELRDMSTWAPSYPDAAPGAPPRPVGGEFAPAWEAIGLIDLARWSATFPDMAPGPLPRQAAGASEPPWAALELVDLSRWAPSYPDIVPGARRNPEGGLTSPPSDTSNVPLLSWAPSYPDRIDRRRQTERVEVFEFPQHTEVPDLSWSPTYPDFARSHLPRLEGGTFAPPVDTSSVPYLSWAATYPDSHVYRYPVQTGWFCSNVEPISTEATDGGPPYHAVTDLVISRASLTMTWCRSSAEGESFAALDDIRSLAVLDVQESRVTMSYQIKTGDLEPTITATLTDQDNTAVVFAGTETVTFKWRLKGASSWTSGTGAFTDAGAGTVYYRFTSGQTDTAGNYQCQWVITNVSNQPRTFPSEGYELFYIND